MLGFSPVQEANVTYLKSVAMFIGAALFCLLTPEPSWAQAVAGSQVSGIVRDSSGGALPGAEVTITKTDTGTVRTAFTNADGSYVLPNLPVGPYQLKVVLQGFNAQLTMLDRAGGNADFSASESGADFGSAGPRERKPALAGAGAGGKSGDLDDEIPF